MNIIFNNRSESLVYWPTMGHIFDKPLADNEQNVNLNLYFFASDCFKKSFDNKICDTKFNNYAVFKLFFFF